ncbi:GNAT family N-acetyltransferase [Cupriavidus taiwanensis]|nr:GNAT family N-acetyltransferase [Cupriavidus taiwanensis]
MNPRTDNQTLEKIKKLIKIRPLNSQDDRSAFDCSDISMNDWLRQSATQHAQQNLTRTYVAVNDAEPGRLLGYYVLAATRLLLEGISNRLVGMDVSAILLTRLAVDRHFALQGLGGCLLRNALHVVLDASQRTNVQCVLVNATTSSAADFYQHFGFEALAPDRRRLILPMKSILGRMRSVSMPADSNRSDLTTSALAPGFRWPT